MKQYRVIISGDRYPTQYDVSGGSWQGAIANAIRQWKKRFKGSRTNELSIHAQKIITKNQNND